MPPIAVCCHFSLGMLPDFGRLSVEEGEAVGDRSAVQVDELGDTLGDPVGCARDNDPRVAVPEEKDVAEVLEVDEVNDVGDVSSGILGSSPQGLLGGIMLI